MLEESRKLLTLGGLLSATARVGAYLEGLIDGGDTGLEEAIIKSEKTINECYKYIEFKAKELAHGERTCMVDDATVFGWAVHYYVDNEQALEEMKPKKVEKTPAPKKDDKPKKGKAKKKEDPVPVVPSEEIGEAEAPVHVESPDFSAISGDCTQLSLSEEPENIPSQVKSMEDDLPEVPEPLSEAVQEEIPVEEPEIPVPQEEEITGENRRCVVCDKPLIDAFPGKPLEVIRKWADTWMEKYGYVFCCKEHMGIFLQADAEMKEAEAKRAAKEVA